LGLPSEFVLIPGIAFASFSVTLSVFDSRILKTLNRFFIIIFISSLFSLNVINKNVLIDNSYGQDKKFVTEVTARVLEDSREIGGGKSLFPICLLYSKDINLTTTSASGELTIASTLNLYKGQLIRIKKRNILNSKNSLVFVDCKKVYVLNWGNTIYDKIFKIRAYIFDHLKFRINRMQHKSSLLFTALFTGMKENPKGKIFISLRKAGASHILALSGMHLGIISLAVMFLLTLLIGKRVSFIFTLILIFMYVFIVSSGPSLNRALILFTLLGLLEIIGVKIDIFSILVICFLIQVTMYPSSAYRLSFQLSYLALGGIILWSGRIARILPGFIPPGIRGILAASISAQICTSVLVLHSFGVIYPVGIISGILLIPIITLFIWIGIIGLLPIPWFFQEFLFRVMDLLYLGIDFLADMFSLFPSIGAKYSVIVASLFFIILILVKIIKIFPLLNKK